MFSKSPTYRPRWTAFLVLLGYGLLFKLHYYALPTLGVSVDITNPGMLWNFSPFFALTLFAGAVLKDTEIPPLWPLGIMFLGDVIMWFIPEASQYAFYRTQPVIYLAFAGLVFMGMLLRDKVTLPRVIAVGLAGPTLFFIVTNFATWALGTTYPHTLSGLVTCYEMGLPFYRNSLVATAVFGGFLCSPAACYQVKPGTAPVTQAAAIN